MSRAATVSALLLLTGCHSAPATNTDLQPTVKEVESGEVSFYVAGMNRRLKIL